jgi:hypothetical protein
VEVVEVLVLQQAELHPAEEAAAVANLEDVEVAPMGPRGVVR